MQKAQSCTDNISQKLNKSLHPRYPNWKRGFLLGKSSQCHQMETLTQSVVVFSKNYLPINKVNIKRAITLLVTGKAEPMNFTKSEEAPSCLGQHSLAPDGDAGSDRFYGGVSLTDISWEIRSPNVIIRVPAYIRLHHGKERVWKTPAVSRQEMLRRDAYQCQYCGNRKQLTIDHVIPRSKGGKHTWDNVVTACATCNGRKGDRTPEQLGMKLKQLPKAPMHPTVAFAEQIWQQIKGVDNSGY